ncbi:hypothetical protein HSX11_06840 [Oxalobacteraceae bacterium]|nr:hypothetical protein [Oxalobacteraceae bacterium]
MNVPMLKRLLPCALAMLAQQALAAESSARAGKFSSREELRYCMESEAQLSQRKKNNSDYVAKNRAALARIQAEAAVIVQQQSVLDHSDEVAVNALNLVIDQHNQFVEETNAEAETQNALSSAYNDGMLTHNRRCAAMVYRMEDRKAILAERKAQQK